MDEATEIERERRGGGGERGVEEEGWREVAEKKKRGS